ncbi:hypothetical protein EB796_014734 [Bugula neritina]|uniref:Uncharacterized protein n=1 Tax=Bugula neritina TaxID=10212 RepID=A0A7J7JMU4_BUGNE|nr:hypothetical protein EB796_014734 [Bugula neritina]
MTSVLDKQDGDFFKDPENFERMPEMYETDEDSTSEKEDDSEVKIDPAEEETRKLMSSLFAKLNAVSRSEYSPKPVSTKRNKSHLSPTFIVVEEVQPDTVADSARLAPEEIKVHFSM